MEVVRDTRPIQRAVTGIGHGAWSVRLSPARREQRRRSGDPIGCLRSLECPRDRRKINNNQCLVQGAHTVVLDNLAVGQSPDEILQLYPTLHREDVTAVMAYAAELARERVVLTSAA
jgi:hypothetical protein